MCVPVDPLFTPNHEIYAIFEWLVLKEFIHPVFLDLDEVLPSDDPCCDEAPLRQLVKTYVCKGVVTTGREIVDSFSTTHAAIILSELYACGSLAPNTRHVHRILHFVDRHFASMLVLAAIEGGLVPTVPQFMEWRTDVGMQIDGILAQMYRSHKILPHPSHAEMFIAPRRALIAAYIMNDPSGRCVEAVRCLGRFSDLCDAVDNVVRDTADLYHALPVELVLSIATKLGTSTFTGDAVHRRLREVHGHIVHVFDEDGRPAAMRRRIHG